MYIYVCVWAYAQTNFSMRYKFAGGLKDDTLSVKYVSQILMRVVI